MSACVMTGLLGQAATAEVAVTPAGDAYFAEHTGQLPNSWSTHDVERWRAAVVECASAGTERETAGAVAFIGSSSIRLWTSLRADFPGQPVVARGFGGSELADLVVHFERLRLPATTRQVIIYSGANDIAGGKSPEVVLGDLVALVRKIETALPAAEIAYISIAPNPGRWAVVEQVKAANRLIQGFCERNDLVFIDVFPHMLGEDGRPLPDIFLEDRVHLNARGYALWRQSVNPHLSSARPATTLASAH